MPRKREPVTITDLGRYECAQCHVRFAWASTRPIDPPGCRSPGGGRRGGGRAPKYCSNYCAAKIRRRVQQYTAQCDYCFKQFQSRHGIQRFCSKSCGGLARSQVGLLCELPADHWALWYDKTCDWKPRPQKAANPAFVAGNCLRCGTNFISIWLADASSRFCSDTCSRAEGRRKRRARRAGKPYDEGIHWRSLAKRDGLTCYLCNRPCDPSDNTWGHCGPTYPSVDHVIPLSNKDGTDTWDNVRIAHHICNARKGVALVGDDPLTDPFPVGTT